MLSNYEIMIITRKVLKLRFLLQIDTIIVSVLYVLDAKGYNTKGRLILRRARTKT